VGIFTVIKYSTAYYSTDYKETIQYRGYKHISITMIFSVAPIASTLADLDDQPRLFGYSFRRVPRLNLRRLSEAVLGLYQRQTGQGSSDDNSPDVGCQGPENGQSEIEGQQDEAVKVPEGRRTPIKKRKSWESVLSLLDQGSADEASSDLIGRASSLLASSTAPSTREPTESDVEEDMDVIIDVETSSLSEDLGLSPDSARPHSPEIQIKREVKREYVEAEIVLPGTPTCGAVPHEVRVEFKPRPALYIPCPETMYPDQERFARFSGGELILNTMPDEFQRLERARYLLNRPGEFTLHYHPEMDTKIPNLWADSVRRLQRRIRGGQPISLLEFQQLYLLNGHLGVQLVESLTRTELARAVYSREPMFEVGMGLDISVPYLNAPRVVNFLCLDPEWKTNLRAIVIGYEELLFQPDALRHTYLNLGEYLQPTYTIRTAFEALTLEEIQASGLYRSLERKLDIIGRDSTLPILIEYTKCVQLHTFRVDDMVGSFLKIIQEVQKRYCGPIIVVTVSPSVKLGDTPETFRRKKDQSLRTVRSLALIGRAIGVATAHLWVAKMHGPDGEYHSNDSKWLPLYTAGGLHTNEYFRKLTSKMEELVNAVENQFTSGLERRMAAN